MFAIACFALLVLGLIVTIGLRLNSGYIPGPYDAQMLLEDAAGVTKTADYDGASLDLGSGYAPGGIGQPMAAVVDLSDLDLASSDETYAFTLQESDDDGTFTDCGPAVEVAGTGAVSVPGFVSKRYVRCQLDVSGTTPSATYTAHLVPLGPLG